MIGFHKPFQDNRTWSCFLFLQTVENSAYAKLRYITLKFDEV
jgi:hypothetical protein